LVFCPFVFPILLGVTEKRGKGTNLWLFDTTSFYSVGPRGYTPLTWLQSHNSPNSPIESWLRPIFFLFLSYEQMQSHISL
jgi:hypothetical protein